MKTLYLGTPCKRGHLAEDGIHTWRVKTETGCDYCPECTKITTAQGRAARIADYGPSYLGRPCRKNPAHILDCGKSRRDSSNSKCMMCEAARWVKKRKDNPLKERFNNKRNNARREGIEFTLVFEDLVWPKYCPVIKEIKINYALGEERKGFEPNSPSFDRIDPAGGYTPGNVIIVSNKANVLKNNGNLQEIAQVLSFYSNLQKTPTQKE